MIKKRKFKYVLIDKDGKVLKEFTNWKAAEDYEGKWGKMYGQMNLNNLKEVSKK